MVPISNIITIIFYIGLVHSIDDNDDLPNLETITIEDYVYVLDDSNYDTFVQQNSIALIEFYAPWCGHCKSLAPEYSKAAKILQDENSKVVLAKIDASKFLEFSRKHDVAGYPTLFVYKNGTKNEYDGPRTAQGIADYMREISDPNYQLPEEAVITLTEANFDSIIAEESLILVEFYAPWCGHCKRLKPEYERAARRLKLIKNPIKLAKIDATVETELAKRFEVKGYPTLFVFRNGKKYVYKGPRDENGIVEYMQAMNDMPSELIESREQLRKKIKHEMPTIVGFFNTEPEQELFDLFINIAFDQFDEDNHFLHIKNTDLIQQLKQKPNSLALFLPIFYASAYEPNTHLYELEHTTTVEDVVRFIGNNSVPLVGYRNSRSYNLYANRYPQVVVYYDVDFSFDHRKQTQLIREQVLQAAAQIRKTENITFMIANESENEHELKELKLDDSGEDVNVGYFETMKKRYAMEPTDEFNSKALIDFVLSVKTGKIKPVIRSQFSPETNPTNNIWSIVGDTFDQLVTKCNQYDKLIEFYAPWCGHCKAFEATYKELAQQFLPEQHRLRVMKIDASANDFPEHFEVNGFPTIYYVHANDPFTPIPYNGERNLEKLTKFVRQQLDGTDDKESGNSGEQHSSAKQEL